MAAKNAVPKLLIVNPGTNFEVIISMNALITKENRPNVIIVIGKVKMDKTGFITAFINPKTRAATKAAVKPEK